MKLTVLGFLAISASASMSSGADQHGKDNNYALRDLKEHKKGQKEKNSPKKPSENKSSKAKKVTASSSEKPTTAPSKKPHSMSHSMMTQKTTTAETSDSAKAADATLAPAIEVEATRAADVIPACPPAYDIAKTDYRGGDRVTVTDNIFECHSLYVKYCNIGEWDVSLLTQDENADEMWSDAWVYVGPCV